jgi:capsular polysaccharide biosynthesis protein
VTPAPTQPDSKAVALSGRLYQRLLAAYPKAHRRDYGPAMAQLFRDQCRDAWRAGRGWSLAWLWLRALPDLVKSSVLEHLSTLNERKTMLERLGMLLRPRSAPWLVFSGVFVLVFFFVVATTTLITFIMPESYGGTARVLVRQAATSAAPKAESQPLASSYDPYYIQTQLGIIESEAVLGPVIEDLDLNKVWGARYAGGGPLRTSETIALLKRRIELRPVRNTWLIQVRAFSDEPAEAAQLANAVALSYCKYSSRTASAEIGGPTVARLQPLIIDTAVPGLRPVRPNKPLNIALGVAAGLLLALAAGAAMAGIAAWLGRRSRRTCAPPGDFGHPKTTLDNVTGS